MIDPKDLMAGGNQPTPDDPSQAPDAATGGDAVPHDMQSQMAAAREKLGIPAPAPQNADGSTTAAAPEQSTPPIVDATPAPKQGLVSKFAAGANEAAKQNPQPNAPGAWAKNLLGGIVSSLGDASHATDNLKPGQGGLSGILNTLAARSSRQAGEKQQQFKNNIETSEQARKQKETDTMAAETLARTYNYGLQSNKLAQEIDENAVKLRQTRNNDGKLAVEPYRKWHDVQDGISQNDLQTRMATYMKNPDVGADGKPIPFATQFHIFQTGDEEIQGPDGSKHVVPTYSVVKSSEQQVEITDKLHDLLAKNLPKGDVPPVGTKIDGHLYDNQITQAMQVNAAYEAMEASGVKRDQLEDTQNFRQAMQVAGHFMADNIADPFEGLQGGLNQAKTKIAQDTQALALAQKAGDQNAIQKAQDMLTQANSEKSAIETIVNSPAMEKQRETYNEKLTIQREKEKEKAEEKAKAQDKEEIGYTGQSLAQGLQDFSQVPARGAAKEAYNKAANEYSMANYGVPYEPAKRNAQFKFAQNTQTQNTLKYLGSLTGGATGGGGGGNLGELIKQSNGINRTDFPAINDVEAWAKLQTGDKNMAAYRATVTEVADQVAKILQGGGSGNGTTDAKLKQAQELFDKGFSKDSIVAVGNALQPLLANRSKSMIGDNVYLLRQYGSPQQVEAALRNKDPWADGLTQPVSEYTTSDGQKQQQPQVLDKPPVDGAIRMKDPKTGNIHWISPDKIEAAKKYGGIEVK